MREICEYCHEELAIASHEGSPIGQNCLDDKMNNFYQDQIRNVMLYAPSQISEI